MKSSRPRRNKASRRFVAKKKKKKTEKKKQYESNTRGEGSNRVFRSGPKARDDALQLEGTVTESLPSGIFSVELDNKHQVVAHMAGKLARNRIWILPGDKVTVELSPYDLARGRIVWRDSGRRRRI